MPEETTILYWIRLWTILLARASLSRDSVWRAYCVLRRTVENPPVCRDMGIMVVSSGQSPMNQFIELGTVQADKLQIIELVNTSPTNCRDTYVHGRILQRAFVAVERLSLPRLLHFIIDPGNLSFRPLPFPLRLLLVTTQHTCPSVRGGCFQLDPCSVIGINLWDVARL